MGKLPNFFIVGAPKCGTTALYSYLRQHPQIFMSPHKEPTFFGKDLVPPAPYFVREQTAYTDLFNGSEKFPLVGEASVYYLVSEEAAREIYAVSPEAKILIMIRNPIDMMYSWHSQLLYTGLENEKSFEKALNLESDRALGLGERGEYMHMALLYKKMATFSEQIERYFKVFGRENVHVVLLEEFSKNSSQQYGEILSFLGVNNTNLPDFSVVNSNKEIRLGRLQNFLRVRPRVFRLIVKWVVPLHVKQKVIGPLIRGIKKLNTRTKPRLPLSSGYRLKLRREFDEEIKRLETLLNRDLPY
jgi:hypothetical protein